MVVRVANETEKSENICCMCGQKKVEFNATENNKEYLYCGRCAPYIGEHINGDNDN